MMTATLSDVPGDRDVTVSRSITHRDYGHGFIEGFEQSVADGHKSHLGVLPTGAGKTSLAGEIIARIVEGTSPIYRTGRALWLAHRRGLVIQAHGSMKEHYGMEGAIEMGPRSAGDSPLVFSTVQSMANRISSGRFPRDHFDLMVIDEAHRALAHTHSKLHNYFRCHTLGITATPRRGDQRDLMQLFDNKFIDLPLDRLIRDGHLCRLKIVNFPLEIDLRAVPSKAGDYDEAALCHAIEPYLGACAMELAKYTGRKMLVYLPLISTSKRFRQHATAAGLRFVHLDGTSPQEDQEQAIEDLRTGKIDGICNSILLTEGIDIPWADLVLNLRATKSWPLYVQVNGRLTRNYPGKDDAIILDPLWLCDEHSMLQRPASLLAKDEEEEEAITKIIAGGGDLIDAQQSFADDKEESLRERLAQMATRKAREFDAMEFFLAIGDIGATEYEPMAKWEKEKITPGQRAMLEKSKFDLDTVTTKGQASQIISAIVERSKKGLATVSQCRYASSLGMEDAWSKTFSEVREYIRITNNRNTKHNERNQ